MEQKEKSLSQELENLRNQLNAVNERLIHVESSLEKLQVHGNQTVKEDNLQSEDDFEIKLPFPSQGSIEFGLGEYGMAWLGNAVLFLGVIFLIGFLQKTGNPVFSSFSSFVAVAGIYVSAWLTRKYYSYLSGLFEYNGHLLLYFFTLRLHFFQENPVVKNETLGLVLLAAVSIVLFLKAYRKKSQLMIGMTLFMLIATGAFSSITAVSAGLIVVVAVISIWLYYRFGWLKLAFVFIFLTYIFHLNWLINRPLTGNSPEFILSPGLGYFFFILTGFIFSLLALIPKKEEISDGFIISSIIWNGLGFTFLLAAISITYFSSNYVPVFISVTLFCLIYAVILQLRSSLKITASMYVLYGFLALSVVLFGIFGLPESYALFALQSLFVLSIALWFRSRFMVVMNTILFLFFMVFYIKGIANLNNYSNFAFMLVALISARIINWKKERLNIKTEIVRNLYLVLGFFMTLFTFYHLFPPSFRTASWILAAILFFLLGRLIKNIKYRWIAIAAMIASAIRLIFIDMSTINIGYRVLIFLVLAIISISVSIIYTKFLTERKMNQ